MNSVRSSATGRTAGAPHRPALWASRSAASAMGRSGDTTGACG